LPRDTLSRARIGNATNGKRGRLGDTGRGDTDAADNRHRGYDLDHDTSHDYLLRDCAMDASVI
jgi:hypothetical protein